MVYHLVDFTLALPVKTKKEILCFRWEDRLFPLMPLGTKERVG